jgi:hypothetical protein
VTEVGVKDVSEKDFVEVTYYIGQHVDLVSGVTFCASKSAV